MIHLHFLGANPEAVPLSVFGAKKYDGGQKAFVTEGSHVVTYHSTNSACRRLASEFGWDLAFVDEV